MFLIPIIKSGKEHQFLLFLNLYFDQIYLCYFLFYPQYYLYLYLSKLVRENKVIFCYIFWCMQK